MLNLATQTWRPNLLGYPEADGFNIASDTIFSGADVADGPTRYKQDMNYAPYTASIRCIMDRIQFRYFEYWFYAVLNGGYFWFNMPLRTGAGLLVLNAHFTKYSARFMGGRDAPAEVWWEVTFDIDFLYTAPTPIQPEFYGNLIEAGTAEIPSRDGEIHAGTADAPSTGGEIHAELP